MDDKLKKFIYMNRDGFDTADPPEAVFNQLVNRLKDDSQRKKRMSAIRWAAIIATPLVLIAAIYFSMNKKDSAPAVDTGTETELAVKKTGINDPVYARQLWHFMEIIDVQQSELKQLEKDYPTLYREFITDINQLDSSYQSLKINLAENPNRELLLEAMIQNLQLQCELLNRQLRVIKEVKQKSKNHEKNTV